MIEIETPTPEAQKPKRKRRVPTAERKPRRIDPGIAAIHWEANEKVKVYRNTIRSMKIRETIVNKRLSQLTQLDREKLMDALLPMVSPPLIALNMTAKMEPLE